MRGQYKEGNARMRGTLSTFRKIIVRGYAAVAICMLVIVVFILLERHGFRVDYGFGSFADISGAWTTEDGRMAELFLLEKESSASIHYLIPQMEKDTSLVYRTQNVFVQVYLDGEMVYETERLDQNFYDRYPGSRWNLLSFSPDQAGQQLELRITEAYAGEGLKVDHFYWGDRAAIVLAVIREKLASVLISFVICLVGLFMIVLDIPLNHSKKRKNHGLRFLGLFSVFIGGWCLVETNVLHFFYADPQILQAIDNILLILSVLPMVLYADWTYGILRYRIIRIACVLHMLFLLACVIFPVAGLTDWHGMLPVARVFMGFCAMGFVAWTAKKNISILSSGRHRRGAGVWAVSLQLLGISAIGITVVLELVRFSGEGVMDSALILRFGLLVFIICFAVGSQFSAYQLMVQGMEYDSVHKLAYSDILTDLGNRTAYLERLEECVNTHVQELGVVFMDINNLKTVNDSYGHDMGDMMIQMASKVIEGSFGDYGMVFRLGGDEFCALLEGDVRKKYAQALEAFQKGIRDANDKNEYSFTLQIAHGFAICEADSKESVEKAVQTADERMYQNKAQLKA